MVPLSDEDLVARYRAAAGSPEAESLVNELFQRHHARVALWCLRLTGDRESAADMAQEVFIKVFRHLDFYRGDSKFSTWLYSITRNHCFNELKSRATVPETLVDPALFEVADSAPSALAQLERENSARTVRELIASSLSELETQVMTLHYVEELPIDKVTRLLHLENASGAKAYIVSARRKLTRAVERWNARNQDTHR